MKPVRFHPAAYDEAIEAGVYYERQQAGLGLRFIVALTDALQRISANPELYRMVDASVRKCRVLRFPYGVIFRSRNDRIEIIAVMNLRRRPGYWKSRI
jgi:toxin ParE1/3/4